MASRYCETGKFSVSIQTSETRTVSDDKCIQDFIRCWSDIKPEDEAFVFVSVDGGREVVTWRDLYANSVEYAHAFLCLGLQLQHIVGISIRACPQCLYLYFGAIFAGIIPIDVVFTSKDCHDVVALLNTLKECHTVIIDPNQDHVPWSVFRSFFTSTDGEGAVSSLMIPSVKYLIPTSVPRDEKNPFIVADLLQRSRRNSSSELPRVDPGSIAFLLQTSGSTGLPKAVAHTHKSIIHFILSCFCDQQQRVYTNRIFNWSNCWPSNVITGQTWVCQSNTTGSAGDKGAFIMKVAQQERCAILNLIPPQIEDIMNLTESRPQSWKVASISVTGQRVTQKIARCLGVLTSTLNSTYGSTESLGVLKMTVRQGETFEDGWCGVPMEGVQVKIVDDNDEIVPINTKGELLIRSASLFTCYYNEPEKTRSVFTEDGWFRSDDIARMTEDGAIFVEGRKSDMIICDGTNVWPASIENVLLSHPGIKSAMVVPIPHEVACQEICACIVPRGEVAVSEAEVRQFCNDAFTDKRADLIIFPHYYIFFDNFPVTRTGKFSRKQLTCQAVERILCNK